MLLKLSKYKYKNPMFNMIMINLIINNTIKIWNTKKQVKESKKTNLNLNLTLKNNLKHNKNQIR